MSERFSYTAVTLVHNAARTLDRTLRALEGLQPPPTRIIVVDDASTDGAAEIAAGRARVTVVRLPENRGPSGARNEGVRRADAPWVLLVDADCYVSAEGFRAAIALLERQGDLDGVMGVFEPDAPSGPLAGRYKNFYRHCEIAGMDNPPHVFTSSCFLIRKSAYERAGGFNESFGTIPTEDNEFYYRFVESGHRMRYLTQFAFTHDKPMGMGQLFREDAERVEAIVRNLRGQLGVRREGFGRGERWRYLAELVAGLGVLAGPIGLAAGWLIGGRVLGASVVVWLASICGLCLVNVRVLKRAVALHGVGFAFPVVWYRAVEMLAAGLGMARALRPGRHIAVGSDPSSPFGRWAK
jgi:GT2 family glycosyltransferase